MGTAHMKLSRRTFVRSSALLAAASAVPPIVSVAAAEQLSEAGGKPSPIRLGLATYTFRNFTRAQMLGFLKQLNITSINPKDTKDHLPMDPAAQAQAVADYAANGIHLHAAGAIYFPKDEDDDIRSKFEYCKRAGIKVIVAGDPIPAALPRIEKFVKEYDIRFAIHNHGPEDKIFPSPLDVLKAVSRMDPRMGCCIDVGHCVRAGTDVVEAIRTVGPRLFNVHMKDLASFTDKESQVAVGEGKMPVREIFEALVGINYPGWVDLEYEIRADDPMPGVSASFSYMRGVLTGMGYNPKLSAASF
jgi:sugar phosphate isomerase/epimerase